LKVVPVLMYFISFTVFACGEPSGKPFIPFAVLKEKEIITVQFESVENKEMNTYELNFPIKDSNKKDFFLNSISISVLGQFDISLDYFEKRENKDKFYTAYIRINKSLEDKVQVSADYNGSNKEETGIYLCGNSKGYKLTNLLEAQR